MTYRVGIGYDIHRLERGSGVILAGVDIPCEFRLVAHSDGDVVLHALCDALLGAVGAGDLGEHFPDTAAVKTMARREHGLQCHCPSSAPWSLQTADAPIISGHVGTANWAHRCQSTYQ